MTANIYPTRPSRQVRRNEMFDIIRSFPHTKVGHWHRAATCCWPSHRLVEDLIYPLISHHQKGQLSNWPAQHLTRNRKLTTEPSAQLHCTRTNTACLGGPAPLPCTDPHGQGVCSRERATTAKLSPAT